VRKKNPCSGATLVVTLGILTVLSVIIAAFFVSSRIGRQTHASDQHRATARNHIEEAIALAMRVIEESMTYPNYTGDFKEEDSTAWASYDNKLNQFRLAPIGPVWFTEDYCATNGFVDASLIEFQAENVLASPTLQETPEAYVNLLTPQVLRLLPPVLTNDQALAERLQSQVPPLFRSGWHEIDLLANASVDMKLTLPLSRVAFVAFNCSSLFDVNHFGMNSSGENRGPTSDKIAAVCFSQADVTNWVNSVQGSGIFTNLEDIVAYTIPHESPFGFLSYDPGPDTYPLHYDCFETSPTLGRHSFNAWGDMNLNGLTREALSEIFFDCKENANYHKFNINSITNFCQMRDEDGTLIPSIPLDATPWYNDADFRVNWLEPVAFLMHLSLHEEDPNDPRRIPTPFSAFAWTVANQIDAGRVPRVSDFPTDDNPNPDIDIYSRTDYALKDVPLINKVHVFNIFDGDTGEKHPDSPKDPYDYYGLPTDGTLSNHYAVAVELWYPFAPHEPPENAWCYVGVVTNEMEALTTTNRAWTAGEVTDWFNWRDAGRDYTSMQLFFEWWGQQYRTSSVSNKFLNIYSSAQTVRFDYYYDQRRGWVWEQRKEDHPLWQVITGDKEKWFTDDMDDHDSWKALGDENDFSITNTPIWQAFFPETDNGYAEGVVVTNYYITWLYDTEEEDLPDNPGTFVTVTKTNRLTGVSSGRGGANPRLTWDTGISTRLTEASSPNVSFGPPAPESPTPGERWVFDNLVSLSMAYEAPQTVTLIIENMTAEWTAYTTRTNIFGTSYTDWGTGTNYAWMLTESSVTTNSGITSLELLRLGTNYTASVSAGTLFVDYEVDPNVLPLPREGVGYMWDILEGVFDLMPKNTLTALREFLMFKPGANDFWDNMLFQFFNYNLDSINKLTRSHQTPTRHGGRPGINYFPLPPPEGDDGWGGGAGSKTVMPAPSGIDNEYVIVTDCRDSRETYGVYYTIFPKTYVCFQEIEEIRIPPPPPGSGVRGPVPLLPPGGGDGGREISVIVTNYFPLGAKDYRLWVSPAVALEDPESINERNDRVGHVYLDNGDEAGCIVDEALLLRNQEGDFLPMAWNSPGLCYAPDPRRNAWDSQWIPWDMPEVPDEGGDNPGSSLYDDVMRYNLPRDRDAMDLENYNWAVKELPFIVTREPFQSIGDIGHVYVPYRDYRRNRDGRVGPNEMLTYDTVTFATRSGASLLDMFTIAPTNRPKYGLVQANTQLDPVAKTLLSDIQAGWIRTNAITSEINTENLWDLKDDITNIYEMTDVYTNALTAAPFSMGWKSYADMMPMLLSIDKFQDELSSPERLKLDGIRGDLEQKLNERYHERHDYMEDITRGLVDKVSFRQNVYMVVVAAQTLSRTSTPNRPIVLADQRALVTIIRDAWSGRWIIHDWKWLTE